MLGMLKTLVTGRRTIACPGRAEGFIDHNLYPVD